MKFWITQFVLTVSSVLGSWCGGFACGSTLDLNDSIHSVKTAACMKDLAQVRSIAGKVLKYKPVSKSPLKQHINGFLTIETPYGIRTVSPNNMHVHSLDLFRLGNNVSFVLKYHADKKLPSFAWEYGIGEFLGENGIGPLMHWMSPPLQSTHEGRLFRKNKIFGVYIISEEVGLSANAVLDQYLKSRHFDEKQYLDYILSIGKGWLVLISGLHGLGIVHGDISGESIVLKREFESESFLNEYYLTNFAQTRFVCDDSTETTYGYGDDVFGVLKTILNWISFKSLGLDEVDIHTEINLLADNDAFDIFKSYFTLTPLLTESMKQCLNEAFEYIRSIDSKIVPLIFQLFIDAIECARGVLRAARKVPVKKVPAKKVTRKRVFAPRY